MISSSQSELEPKAEPAGPLGLRDDVIDSLFGAALALDCLAGRLTHPDDNRQLDAAVQHLDAAVRDIRLMLRDR